MSTIGSQTMTVSTVERTYNPSWDRTYAADLKKGNTAVKKASLTGATSIMRITHDDRAGVEKHILSFEDRNSPDANGQSPMEKIQITLSCAKDDAAAEARLIALTLGVADYIKAAGVLDSLVADEI